MEQSPHGRQSQDKEGSQVTMIKIMIMIMIIMLTTNWKAGHRVLTAGNLRIKKDPR